MAAKRNPHPRSAPRLQTGGGSLSRFLLATSLVPLVIGGLLIVGWALDILFWEGQIQPIVGGLFILLSFAAANALQRNWNLAVGWLLLAIADVLVLSWLHIWVQIFSGILALIGISLLLWEFYQRYKTQKKNPPVKKGP